jgi:GDP-L-fucose synthase
MPRLRERYGPEIVHGVGSGDYDLLDPIQARAMFGDVRPAVVIHLAAYSGGIGANRAWPADFYYRNTLLTAHVFHEAARHEVRKLIYLMGGCSYPAGARSPIGEDQMWEGFPQADSAGYSMAKKMGLVASECHRRQHGLDSVVLIPGNMYGEWDNFRREESHVIPALIRRFHEAHECGAKEVVLWGTGRPVRDFVYAGDVAAVIPEFIEPCDLGEPMNISSGIATSIADLAHLIKDLIAFDGEIIWDDSQPDGQMQKVFDVTRLGRRGLSCPTSLSAGLRRTIDWFRKHSVRRQPAIRL